MSIHLYIRFLTLVNTSNEERRQVLYHSSSTINNPTFTNKDTRGRKRRENVNPLPPSTLLQQLGYEQN